jgi:hypothetical protein
MKSHVSLKTTKSRDSPNGHQVMFLAMLFISRRLQLSTRQDMLLAIWIASSKEDQYIYINSILMGCLIFL